MNKFRVSLIERFSELRGTVELPVDAAFALEALQLVIERMSIHYKVPAPAIVQDLYSLVLGKVT